MIGDTSLPRDDVAQAVRLNILGQKAIGVWISFKGENRAGPADQSGRVYGMRANVRSNINKDHSFFQIGFQEVENGVEFRPEITNQAAVSVDWSSG